MISVPWGKYSRSSRLVFSLVPFPTARGVGEVHVHGGRQAERGVVGHLAALVPGEGLDQARGHVGHPETISALQVVVVVVVVASRRPAGRRPRNPARPNDSRAPEPGTSLHNTYETITDTRRRSTHRLLADSNLI